MTAIHPTDVMQVTVLLAAGQTSVTLSGLSSMADLIREVRTSLPDTSSGLLTLRIRNRTQGWIQQHTIRLASTPAPRISATPRRPSAFSAYPSLF